MSFKAVQQADGPLTRASKLGLPAQTCLACPWLCVSLHKVSRVAPYRKYLEIPYGIAETVSALLKMQVSIQRPCSIYYNLALTDKADFQLETLPFARCTHLGAAAEVVVLLFWVNVQHWVQFPPQFCESSEVVPVLQRPRPRESPWTLRFWWNALHMMLFSQMSWGKLERTRRKNPVRVVF